MAIVSQHTNLPPWAHNAAQRAKQAQNLAEQGKPQSDTSVHLATPNAERTADEVNGMREAFVTYRVLDEDPRFDKALGQVGVFKDESGEVHLQGTSLAGSMEIRAPKAIARYAYDQSKVSFQRFRAEGEFEASSLDLASPQTSFQLSTNSFQEGAVEVPKSPCFEATQNASQVLSSLPKDRPESIFREIFLDGSKSMTKVREGYLKELGSEAKGAGLNPDDLDRITAMLQSPYSGTPRQLAQELSKLNKSDPGNEKLAAMAEKAGFWQSIEDFPKLKADGIMRAAQYYISPQHLQSQAAALGWDFDTQTGLPVADTVIVGGGPGGLSTAYHLSERGTRTVLFEGGHVGQGFSDAAAQSVHQLRTNGAASNLLYTANANVFGIDVSMQRHLAENRKKCSEARVDWSNSTREEQHGFSHARGSEVAYAANRGELFEHMSHVAHGLAVHYPDTMVSENSPVSKIEKLDRGEGEPQLFKVTTERGHEVLTRSLVMATGFVGGDGEHARSLSIFQNLEDTPNSGVTVLPNDHDLFQDNDTIDSELLVLSERLMGRPEIRQRIKALPEGSRISVIGGGESATKGALEALHLNPNVVLDLYTSSPLEPYQTQIPTSVLAPAVTEAGIRHKEVADRTLATLEGFGTPVTSETLQELFQLESEGRVRIHELGQRFDQDTIHVTSETVNGAPSLKFEVKDQEVAASLRQQRADWLASGLYGDSPPSEDPTNLPKADMVIVAAGYDKRSLRAGPLIQQLIEQDLVELSKGEIVYGDDGLTSGRNPLVSFNTAGAIAMASDTAIPGRAIRAYRLAQNFDAKLPARAKPTDRVPSGLAYGNLDTNSSRENFNWSKADTLRFIDNNGGFPEDTQRAQEQVDKLTDPAEKASAQLRLNARTRFPGPNSALAGLMVRAHEVPESLTPAERLMWERAQKATA
jgi:FAD dependent oxidoreductase